MTPSRVFRDMVAAFCYYYYSLMGPLDMEASTRFPITFSFVSSVTGLSLAPPPFYEGTAIFYYFGRCYYCYSGWKRLPTSFATAPRLFFFDRRFLILGGGAHFYAAGIIVSYFLL